jgi:opacity protein-like surface antigen
MRFLTLNRLTLLAALAFATPALAAPAPAAPPPPKKTYDEAPLPPPPSNDGMKLGVGLAVMGSSLNPGGGGIAGIVAPIAFYVPIDIGGKFRIEPWFGMARGGDRGTGSQFGIEFGAGGFMLVKPVSRINAYLGARLGLGILSVSTTNPATGVSSSNTGVNIGILPAAGIEYMPDPHFSVGIEGQLGLIIRTGGGTIVDFGTNGLAFLRYYL